MDRKKHDANIKISESCKKMMKLLLFACIPLAACCIMCAKDGISLHDIYLGNSKWNDEVIYFKITEAIGKYNTPLGYFGYNESTANIGRFGAWSPVIFLFQIVYVKLFNWSMLSPIYCNIILMMIAMFVFAFLVMPTKRQMLFICLFYCTCTMITRYVLSGMLEASLYSLLIIFLGITIKAYRTYKESFKIRYLLMLNLLAFVLVLMRPYWILLFAVPAWYWYVTKTKKKALIMEAVISVTSLVIYFYIAGNLCAPYLRPIINLSWLKLVFTDPGKGLYNIVYIFASQMKDFLQRIGQGVAEGAPVGAAYTVFCVMMIYFAFSISKCKKAEKNKKWCLLYALGYLLVMLLAIFYLYDLHVGSRHIIGFILVFMLLFPLIETNGKRNLLLCSLFIWLFVCRATDEHTYQIPTYTADKGADLAEGKEELADLIDVNADDPWDNTIIWLYSDETMVNFTYLYAVPGGMGINLCFKDYVLTNFEQLRPRYIITNIGEEVDLLCEEKQKELEAEYGNVHIWRLR